VWPDVDPRLLHSPLLLSCYGWFTLLRCWLITTLPILLPEQAPRVVQQIAVTLFLPCRCFVRVVTCWLLLNDLPLYSGTQRLRVLCSRGVSGCYVGLILTLLVVTVGYVDVIRCCWVYVDVACCYDLLALICCYDVGTYVRIAPLRWPRITLPDTAWL